MGSRLERVFGAGRANAGTLAAATDDSVRGACNVGIDVTYRSDFGALSADTARARRVALRVATVRRGFARRCTAAARPAMAPCRNWSTWAFANVAGARRTEWSAPIALSCRHTNIGPVNASINTSGSAALRCP